MKQDDTKNIIIEKALELFSERGYDSVSVDEIAKAVGIKAPSLYNHYKNKQEIFNAIVEKVTKHYEEDTDKADVHVQSVERDIHIFDKISADALFEKVKWIFDYSLNDVTISRFRKMMTIEQFRSPELSALYTERYIDRLVYYHAQLFRALITLGKIKNENPETLSLMYVSPVITLLGICDRQKDKYDECLHKLERHVKLFYRTYTL